MQTPTRHVGANNLNVQTPRRTPATARSRRPAGTESVASTNSASPGGAWHRAGVPQFTPLGAIVAADAAESPLPLRPGGGRGVHGEGYRHDTLDSLRYTERAPLVPNGGGLFSAEMDDEDELFTRYSDFYYDPNTHYTDANTDAINEPATGLDGRGTRDESSGFACCCGHSGACARNVLLCANGIVLLCASAAFFVGFVAREALEASLHDLCQYCDDMYTLYLMLTGVLIGTAFLGCVMLLLPAHISEFVTVRFCDWYTFNVSSCCRLFYMLLLVCVFFLLCCCLLSYSLVLSGYIDLGVAWDVLVQAADMSVCDVELHLECNGWDQLCAPMPATRASAAVADSHHTRPGTAPSLSRNLCPGYCPELMQRDIDTYNQTCASVAQHHLKSNAYLILVPGATLAVMALLALVTTFATGKRAFARRRDPADTVLGRYRSASAAPYMTVSVVEE